MTECVNQHSLDQLLDALGNVQRRTLLRELLIQTLQDTKSVTVNEGESTDQELTEFLEMSHIHLPKLASEGYIIWNRDSQEVSKGPNFEEIQSLLGLLGNFEDELQQKGI
jgi:hypothetical protein